MEHKEYEARGGAGISARKQKPRRAETHPGDARSGEDVRASAASGDRKLGGPGSVTSREATSWVNWQSASYLPVLGLVCVLLAPLTSLWWLMLVLGAAVPVVLAFAPAVLGRFTLTSRRPDDKKDRERELLDALAEKGELTPAGAAMRTSLTMNEASKMLEELARTGHLRPRAEDGVVAYALSEWDRHEIEGEPPIADPETTERRDRLGASQRLDDPLSERELEVLQLLASGRTNAEVARDLFVSVGTVKSHTGNIYRKLGAKNRAEALTRARDLNLLP